MQQPFGEEEHCDPSGQEEILGGREEGQDLHMLIQQILNPLHEGGGQDIHAVMQRLLRKLLHSPQIIALLAVISGALLWQTGLLWLFLLVLIIGGWVFLGQRFHSARTAAPECAAGEDQCEQEPFAQLQTLNDVWLLTPGEFEQMVASVLQQLGYTQVEAVGRSRDLCVDITAIGPHGEKVNVQCKRYTQQKVGSREMQQFIEMIYMHHRADKGMYFTSSSYTKEARALGEQNGIELIDGESLITILHS